MATNAIQAERAVIASIILDNATLTLISGKLSAEDFYDSVNGKIYGACVELDQCGLPIDIATIYTKLSDDKALQERGGTYYLAQISNEIPSAIMIERHAQLVINDSIRRRLCAFGQSLQMDAEKPIFNIEEYVSNASETMHQIIDDTGANSFFDLNTATKSACEEMMAAMQNGGAVKGIQTGFHDLDNIITGLRPGTLTILAARPAMGKTALALNILANVAIRRQIPSAIFSLEMTATELATRIISAQSRVDSSCIKKGALSDEQWDSIMSAVEKMHDSPLFIDDGSGITISTLRDRARRLQMQRGIQFIVVDYLQLLTSGSKRVQNREQEVADIARGLKCLSKELSVPVLALAQLNRSVESRSDKHPLLSDLRESGSIEQDADNILFIHRPAYYDKSLGEDNVAEIMIAKQRNGATGSVNLHWNGKLTEFSSLETVYND